MKKILLYVFVAGFFFTYLKIHNEPTTVASADMATSVEKKHKKFDEPKMDSPELFAELMADMRTKVNEDLPSYRPGYKMKELKKAKHHMEKVGATKRSTANLTFVERGPANVPGRTRGMIIDPNDATGNTWLGASVGGGIWKTTDAGDSWTDMTPDFPNLSTSYMAMSASDNNTIYVGTGEGFFASVGMVDGDGIFKSTDNGDTWTQLASTTDESTFGINVNRIIVDPNNVDILLTATNGSVWQDPSVRSNSKILKSTDGGVSWTTVYENGSRIQDLTFDPNDFNIQYGAINGIGVVKSTDGGDTWAMSGTGLVPGGRVEIAVSPVNSNRIWASAEGGLTGTGSDLYVSDDAGATWNAIQADDGVNADFLGGQGWYDNCLVPHPFDADIAYVGGVHLFKYSVTEETAVSNGAVTSVEENGTDAFFDVVNFSAPYFRGGLDISEDAANRTYVSVELRFGTGRSQMAHRFLVPEGQGSGVPDEDYEYQDYVEVPFEAWDIENNRQLMVSFRDQQRDGGFDLFESNTDGAADTHSREYIYISEEDYDASAPSSTIATQGGHVASDLYFMWPILVDGADSDPSTWPTSELVINWDETTVRIGAWSNIADAYNDFQGLNAYVHPDHQDYEVIIDDESNQEFRLLNSTDGGIYMTNSGTDPGTQEGDWKFTGNGYNTSQFYGADKAPGSDRYFGGMQDNGTWQSPSGEDASATSQYDFRIGGDGYETIWHSSDPNKLIGASQFNGFRRSLDGGETFSGATSGLTDTGSGGAPFVSKVANSRSNPDLIYTVGGSGVWRSEDFGGLWESSPIDEDWALHSNTQIEVSLADRRTVWAGGHMQDGSKIHVSQDEGKTFTSVNNYTGVSLGRVSGLSTHPSDPNTAYVCFSFAETPHILKTTDLGQTWSDITGFGDDGGVSDNGFPDVATHCVLVMPHDENWMWAGTEIGIVESLDGGATWALLDSNFPSVSVWQMQVVDDQVVIATHGRGIWSVTIDGIDVGGGVVVPNIGQVGESPDQELVILANLYSEYETLEIYLGDDLVETLTSPAAGQQILTIGDITTFGTKDVQIIGYVSGDDYPSNVASIDFFEATLSDSYGTTFETNADDFTGDALSFQTGVDGFDEGAIHSAHPYADQQNLVYVLKVPITIAASDATFSYEDIAIIETGETGTVFGDFEFWDYVIVEGTTDGLNWTPIADGYDASFLPSWESKYNANIPPTSLDYRGHEVNLLDTFNAGDKVLFRFRLFADQNTNGWGWVINKVFIQEEEEVETGFEDDVLNQKQAVRTYPNPVQDKTSIEFFLPNRGEAVLEMIDMNGRVIFENNLGIRERGLNSVEWNRAGLKQGIYILKLHTLDGDATTRVQLN